jgi:hypothetical protein
MARTTKVDILYFDGCPSYMEAEKTVCEVLAREVARRR